MKAAPFAYHAPASVAEAAGMLADLGDGAKVLAGGQSLVPLMAFRLVRPHALVDLGRVDSLKSASVVGGVVTIGSMVTHRTVESHPGIAGKPGMLSDALPLVGHVAIRNVGTVGGSLAHADPSAEWPALAVALDATLTVEAAGASREVAASEFFTGFMTTILRPGELLTSVRFDLPGENSGSAFEEVAMRHGDFALAGAAAVVTLEGDTVTDARVALAGAGLVPVRSLDAEAAIIGSDGQRDALNRAGEAAAAASAPLADLHATESHKRHLVSVLTRRAVASALSRARE